MEGRKRKSESPSGSSKMRKTAGDLSEHTDSSVSEPGQTSLECSMEIQMAAITTDPHFTSDSPDQHLRPAAPTPASSEYGPPSPMLMSPEKENPSPPRPLRTNSPENSSGGGPSSSLNLANVIGRLRQAIIERSDLNPLDPDPNAMLSSSGPDNPLSQGPHMPTTDESETIGAEMVSGAGSDSSLAFDRPHFDDPDSESDSDNQI